MIPGLCVHAEHRAEQGSIAELSPGAVGAAGGAGRGRAEHQAAINSMMMERMSTDISALRKQYARIKRRQQQQATQLCIRTGEPGSGCRTADPDGALPWKREAVKLNRCCVTRRSWT